MKEKAHVKSTATFETDNASRYLTLMCEHFSAKTEVTCDAGKIKFPFGQCEMTQDKMGMIFCARAKDQNHLDQVTLIVTNHLERFAFRECPELIWKSDSP